MDKHDISTSNLVKMKETANEEIINKKPLVSIIMPVYNEATFIRRSLGAILEQSYPTELLEIIIADGMSSDNTRDAIEQIKTESQFPIVIVDNPQRIAPAGLNRAIASAKGEIIIRVDGHCEIEPDYVENCVKHLISGRCEGVGGPIETIGETFSARAIALAMSSKFGVGGSAFRTINNQELFVDTVAFPGYKKTTIENAGPFNEELVRNQDDEYNYRIRKLGGKILLSPDIRSRYYSRSSFGSLWKQYFQYGYWKVRVLQLHPRQMSIRQFVPFVFVSTLLLLTVFAIFFEYVRWSLVAILSLYLVVSFSAAVLELRKAKLGMLPLVWLGFAVLHFSYGLGFLTGVFAFWNKRETAAAIAMC